MGKHLDFDFTGRNALQIGVNKLADAIRVTLGPRGRNVILHRFGSGPTVTNDGVTIAREIELRDPRENLGASLAREAATRTQDASGDGTTTAVVLTQALVSEGMRYIAAGANPAAVKRGMDLTAARVVEALRGVSRQVEGRDAIGDVATVSAGGDHVLGALVADAIDRVGPSGAIRVERSRSVDTTLEVKGGIEVEGGYVSPYLVTDPGQLVAVLEDPLILLHDGLIDEVRDVVPALEISGGLGRPILIVAEDVRGDALSTLVVNKLRGIVDVCAVRAPASGERRREILEDVGVTTGATLISSSTGTRLVDLTPDLLGRAHRVEATVEHTLIQTVAPRPELDARRAELTRAIAETDSRFERNRLEERLARLSGGLAVIGVGGATDVELRERAARAEDAVAAAQAAIAEGVVIGGGMALLRVADVLDTFTLDGDADHGRRAVLNALTAPLWQIAANAGEDADPVVQELRRAIRRRHGAVLGFDAASLEIADLVARGVVDPARVTRSALQNAISIAGMILTTETVITGGEGDPGSAD
jgi:chaperonin GroEL